MRDPSAFSEPWWSFSPQNPVYRLGTTGRNFLYKFEAQNGTNTPRWNNPGTGLGQIQRDSSGKMTNYQNFMAIAGVGGLRTAKLGLRLTL